MDTKGISKLDLKRRNRKQILLAIRQAGMLARVDIAAQLSLTRAAVTIITNQMIAQNILEDMTGPVAAPQDEPRRKGRKKTMIRINPSFRYVLGAVINERSISIGLSDINNQPIDQCYLDLGDDAKTEEMITIIVSSCRDLIQKHSLNNKQILGLGVGVVPSRWDQFRAEKKDGKVSFAKLCYLLEMELSIPVLAESAITLYALASVDYADSNTSNQILLYSGKQLHSAAILHNELIGGFSRDTSTVDRIIIKPYGTGASAEGYPDGSVHAELTRAALVARASKLMGRQLTMDEMNNAFEKGEPKLAEMFEDICDSLARLIYNLCTSTQVRCATLQCFRIPKKALTGIQKRLDAMTVNDEPILLRFSDVDGEIAFRAGSALAIENLFFEQGGILPGETNI